MKMTIGRITRTAMLAVAFMLCASSAWAAAKPIAVWNGDFTVESRGGVTVTLNGNSNSDGNLTITDSSSLGTTAGGGVYFEIPSAKRGKHLTTVIGANLSLVDFSATRYLMTFTQGTAQNKVGACLNTSRKFVGIWNGNPWDESTKIGTSAWPTTDTTRYIGYIYNPTAPDTSNSGVYGQDGSRIFVDASSTADYNQSGLRDSGNTVAGVTIGGYRGANTSDLHTKSLTNAKIKFIALFTAGDYATVDDVVYWSLTGMSTVSTDVNTTTTTDGVNLPASATLAAAATPAAVFVQQTSTLTVSDGGSLTIGGGTGPLYVADGTALTIDATGITSLTAQNPSVTLVSAKIYGKDLISVKAPVITGLKVTPTITDTAITLTCATDSVSFTSPFTGSTLEAPTTGTGYGQSATQISFGNNAKFNQTIGDRTAIVVDIFGGTYEKLNGFLYTAENTASDARSKDVYLTLTGGTANRVSGVQDCTVWSNAGTTTTTGDAIVQIEDGATVDFAYGAGGAGGYSGYQVVVNGSTGVTIKGGSVRGSVVGGWTSSHNLNPTVNYDTAVRVETVLGTGTAATGTDIAAGYIIGGSAYNRNGSSASTVGRDSSVTLALAGKSGAFGRTIIGGSAQVAGTTSGNQYVTRNSSVSIAAANDVTFANPVIGGGAKLVSTGAGAVNVGGNSSVTISGGTYTGRIVAGGYAPNGGTANVAGNATLTLNSGVFTGATLDGGNATGAKTLVIGGDVDLSTTSISGFDTLTVAAAKTLTLGGKRLASNVDPMLTSVGTGGKVAFTLTAAEESAGVAYLAKCLIADTTGKFTIKDSSGADITDSPSYEVTVIDGYLVWIDTQTYTVTVDTETAWDSVSWTCAGSSATMATAATDLRADATITLDGGTLVISDAETFIGNLEITGTGTLKFTGSASLMVSSDLVIGSGVTLDFSGLTNLSNFGSDTIILARNLTVNTSSVSFPSTWTCTSANSSTSFVISGYKNDSDSISVNIIGGAASRPGKRVADNNTAGFYPVQGSQWNQIAEKTTTDAVSVSVDVVERLAAGDLTQEAGMVATVSAKNAYTSGAAPTGANAELMYGYLDDGNSGANITVKNIPYSQYAVLVYMGTDQTSDAKNFRPVTVNSISYCGSGSRTVEGSTNWGVYTSARGTVTLAEGSNYLKVTGLTSSTLTVQGSTGSDGYRCGIAGIQIVNTGARSTIYAATLDGAEGTLLPSGESTGMTKTSVGSWSGSSTAKIILTNPTDVNSTVTIGENINTGSLKIRGAGTVTLAIGDNKTLTITDDKVDLTEFSGTLCVDTTVPYSFFAANEAYKTNDGIVRFLGENLEFTGEASLPFGKIAFHSATLKSTGTGLESTYRTIVVEEGDSVTIDSGVKNTSLNFDVRGGSLTMASTDKFWFGIGSRFNQTGGTVTYACEGTQTSTSNSGCSIFGYSSSGTTVSISGGIFDMGKSTLNLWQDGSTLTLSGNAQFKVKGIMAYGNSGRNVTVGGSSKLILTSTQGLHSSIGTLTLSGGTIELQDSAEIAKAMTLTASTESTVTIAKNKTATLSGGVAGTGTLKLAGAGTIATGDTALTNVSMIDLTDGLALNRAVTLVDGGVIAVDDDDVSVSGAITPAGAVVIDGGAITSGVVGDTITISAANSNFTVANVSTQNMPGGWGLDAANSTATSLVLASSVAATVGEDSYATVAAAIAAADESLEDKTVTLTANSGYSGLPLTIPAGVTVDFAGYTLTCGTLTIGTGVVVNMANVSATKVEGSGTVIYDGTFPVTGLGWTDSAWTGTLWLKNYTSLAGNSFNPNDFGNISSTLKFSSVKGWFYAVKTSDTTTEIAPAIEFGDDGDYALWLNDGWGYNSGDNSYYSPIRELKGNGLLKGDDKAGNVTLLVKKWTDFGGSFTLNNKVVVFGSSLPDQSEIEGGGYVIINSGSVVAIKTGKTWSVNKGVRVKGTLAFAGSGSVSGSLTTFDGSTLDFSGATSNARISGTLTLASGTTIKLPAGAPLPYQVATAGDGYVGNVTVQIGNEDQVTGTVALRNGAITTLAPVNIATEKTYTVAETLGAPSATSSYEINVTADATLNIDSAITVDIVKFNVAANKTLTLTGAAITANQIYVYGEGKVSVSSATALSGTIKGDGRIVYTGTLPDSSLETSFQNSNNWSGTVEIKDYEQTTKIDSHRIIVLTKYGNSNSTVALNGVTSTMYAVKDSYPAVTLKEIEIGEGGWTDTDNEYAATMLYTAKLTGHGPITVKTRGSGTVKFIGDHTFDGSVTMDSNTGKRVAFMKTADDTLPLSFTAKAIVVAGRLNMSIASGKKWTAPGGVKIDGSLTVLTAEKATATSVVPTAALDGASLTTTVDYEAGTTTYVTDKVIQISDNQASLGAVIVSKPLPLSGSGGALMSSLTINDGMTLTYDPVITPLRVESAPVFNGTGKLKLAARYAGVTCGKFHLVTYPSSESVSGTLANVIDSSSFAPDVSYTVTEETVGSYHQLVLKVGDYDKDAKEMTIAQFGDSITEGIIRDGYRGTPNYRIPLMQLLEAYGYRPEAKGYRKVGSTDANGVPADSAYEYHTGISAQRIYTGLTDGYFRAGFMESIEAHLEQVGVTDIITLKIGTNDSIGGETADNMFEGWTNLVWKIVRMRPTSKIVVCAPVKIRKGNDYNAPGLRTKIADYVAKTAAEGGFPDGQVTMINGINIVTDDANYYLTDNVHPNWNGHLQLANAWLPAVTNAFESMANRATVGYPAQTAASASAVDELAAYRAGYVKLATFTNFNAKASAWGETPYASVNDTFKDMPMRRVAYFVARKTTASPDTRYVWVDMDADETTGNKLADFGVPTSALTNGVVNNLHICSNSSAIENVAPNVSGVKGTLMRTEKGVSGTAGIADPNAPAGVTWDSSKPVFDWNDSIYAGGAWGVMSVARKFDGATPTNHRKLLAAQMLFDFNGFNGGRQNALGIGDFAVHGPYGYANNSVENFNLNWTFTTDKDEMPTMDARALESGVIEIWGKPAWGTYFLVF